MRFYSKGYKITDIGKSFLEDKALGGFRIPQGREEKKHRMELDKLDETLFLALSYLTFEGDSFIYTKYNKYIPPALVFRLLRFGYIEEDEDVIRTYKEKEQINRKKEQELDKYFRMGLNPPDYLFEDEEV